MQEIFDRISQSYASGRLIYQTCPACGGSQTFARPFCVTCLRPDPVWQEASGGIVVACTTMRRAPTPGWKTRLPYAIALVDLTRGPRVMALADRVLRSGDLAVLRPGGMHDLPFFEPTETI